MISVLCESTMSVLCKVEIPQQITSCIKGKRGRDSTRPMRNGVLVNALISFFIPRLFSCIFPG